MDKNQKPSKSGVKWWKSIFGSVYNKSVPKSHTQMGSLSKKNASEKFSRLGTFKECQTFREIYCSPRILYYLLNIPNFKKFSQQFSIVHEHSKFTLEAYFSL
jgi:hypothetical protein